MAIEIKQVKNSTGDSNISKSYIIPDGVTFEDTSKTFAVVLNEHTDAVNTLNDKVTFLTNEMGSYKTELSKQSTKNIEVIGIFSAILALLIIDTSIIKSVDSLLTASLLIVGMTSSLAIFLALVHKFFSNEKKHNDLGKTFWIPIFILAALVLIGIAFDTLKNNTSKSGGDQTSAL